MRAVIYDFTRGNIRKKERCRKHTRRCYTISDKLLQVKDVIRGAMAQNFYLVSTYGLWIVVREPLVLCDVTYTKSVQVGTSVMELRHVHVVPATGKADVEFEALISV